MTITGEGFTVNLPATYVYTPPAIVVTFMSEAGDLIGNPVKTGTVSGNTMIFTESNSSEQVIFTKI